METNVKRTYESMFLLEAGNPDFEAASQPIRTVLSRYEGEVLALKPWDERKLAYDVGGRKRGLYVLAYFNLDTAKVREVEHDCQLDERILRVLILRKERLTDKELQAPTPATAGPQRAIGEVPPSYGRRPAGPAAPAEGKPLEEAAPPLEEAVPPIAEEDLAGPETV
jgi:small subunit ribosomal protein S6